ncbi:hypothetical protein MTR_1g053485 [Medicago truncatula]|uniref:Uncharacterized protein n=1 Tax=Medicago truncatula TaxID=3880 RepID=A0A072VU74_MEDTR|nr:hypothetical protein MTR_1g053485 [Medicago truncatula]
MMKVPDLLQNSMNEVEHDAFGGDATVSPFGGGGAAMAKRRRRGGARVWLRGGTRVWLRGREKNADRCGG